MIHSMKLSIIVPVYNEEKTIELILDKIIKVQLEEGCSWEIIAVNDCSEDGSEKIILDYMKRHPEVELHYYKHESNKGKGAAIHTGIANVNGDYTIIQDADLEYDPNEYTILMKPVLNKVADVVYGSRFKGGSAHRVLFFWHSIGNHFLTFVSNIFSNLNLTDMETGYKLFRTDIIKKIKLKEKRFGFEPEVTIKISRIPGIRIYEVGISYYGRTYDEGKKINFKDGLWAIICILKYGIFYK